MSFTQDVYTIVKSIPLGDTMTYKYDSDIPCHRVICSDGKTGGYNRGAENKTKLLKIEKKEAQRLTKREQESRSWGYNPCPDGTEVEVVDFSEMPYGRIGNFCRKPGIHRNRFWVFVEDNEGKVWCEFVSRLRLIDKDVGERRLSDSRAAGHKDRNADFLRELPETPFWELDHVRVVSGPLSERLHAYASVQIVCIDYRQLTEKTSIGTPYPCYTIKLPMGGESNVAAVDLELVERGPVWDYYHGKTPTFETVKEEGEFYEKLGRTVEVRNPARECYSWTKDEVLQAINDGIAHGFRMSSFPIPECGPSHSAIRFMDEEVGKRVAQATLEGFAMV